MKTAQIIQFPKRPRRREKRARSNTAGAAIVRFPVPLTLAVKSAREFFPLKTA